MRTFIALDLPEDIKTELAEIITNFRSTLKGEIKWSAIENLHITLVFIGNTKQSEVDQIQQIAKQIFSKYSPIRFDNLKFNIIPAVNPKIIWVTIKPKSTKAFTLYRELFNSLSNIGISLDDREIFFHITLGRIKKRLPNNWSDRFLTTELIANTFDVSQVSFYKSELFAEGPKYTVIEKYKFKKNK